MAHQYQDDPAARFWHFDKRIPLPLLFALAVQTAAVIWWAASTDHRLSSLELSDIEQNKVLETFRTSIGLNSSNDALMKQELESTNVHLRLLRQDLKETNALLRDLSNLRNGNP